MARKKNIFLKILFPVFSVIFGLFFSAPLFAQIFSLNETLNQLDAELSWDPFFQRGVISSRNHHAVFQTGLSGESALTLYDNKTIYQLPAPYMENGLLQFPELFVSSLKGSFNESIREDMSRFHIAAIVVDPGHGGKDAGASGNLTINGKKVKAVEKEITLKVSTELFSKLRAAFPDKKLIMTRTGDTFPTLEDRVLRAHSIPLKENEAVIFISIHANASFNKAARGFEVWYLSPEYRRSVIDTKSGAPSSEVASIFNDLLEEQYTTESVLMAQSLEKHFAQTFGKSLPSRGIKAEEWFVVRKARMPSVLVELGFVTNEEDAKLMLNGETQKKFADAIFKGITDFVERFEKSGGFTQLTLN
jgi:N-acetylmuramoyl-L-alanine amidase